MAKTNRALRNDFCFFVALTSLFGVPGCNSELRFESVLGTPDSRKIVYSDHDGTRLVEYDFTQQTSRVVVADTQIKCTWPAIRSDGQRLAVCRIDVESLADCDDEVFSQRIQIYDLNGQLLHQSSPLEAKRKKPSNSSFTIDCSSINSGLNWSGPSNKILMLNAIYDCENDKWTRLEDIVPFAINNQPVRPDGAGFLGCLQGGKIVFVDWKGTAKQFAESSADVPPQSSTSMKLTENQQWKNFSWKNDIAQLEYPSQVLEFDTSTMKVSSRPSTLPIMKPDHQIETVYRFPRADTQLYTVCKNYGEVQWLVFQWEDADVRKVLLHGPNIHWSSLFFFPSPDNRSVAVRYRVKKSDGPSTILIIDEMGSVTSVSTE